MTSFICSTAHSVRACGPLGARLQVAANLRGGEGVEQLVVGRMHGHELPLKVGSQLGDLQAVGLRPEVVAVGLRLGGHADVDDAAVPRGQLHALVAEALGPGGDVRQRIERRLVAHELGKKDSGSFDLRHVHLSETI